MLKISKKNPYIIITLIYLIIFVPIIFIRYPDIRNELKYFIVIDEMINSKNYFILTYFSELYPDKPPLYFWLLLILKKYTPNLFFPLSILLGSLLPSFGISILVFKLVKKIKNSNFALLSSIMLTTTPFFMGVSSFLRMDMLMSFFISLSLYLFFSLYLSKEIKKINLIFLYISIILGVLTKGGAGFAIPIITIFSFLFLEKNLKFLSKIHIFKGILSIIIILSVWFFIIYNKPEGKNYISLMLNQETIGRISNAKAHSRPFYFYIKKIPLILFPYGIILIGAFISYIKNFKNIFFLSLIEKIGISWGIAPLIFFSLLDGKLDIYLIPLYPGFIIITLSFLYISKNTKIKSMTIKISKIITFIPILFEKIFNKKSKIKHLILSSFIIYLAFPLAINKYNDKFTLNNLYTIIKYDSNSQVFSYKFNDFINMKTNIKKEITSLSNEIELNTINNSKKSLIICKNKYANEISQFENFTLIYKNKSYSLFSN